MGKKIMYEQIKSYFIDTSENGHLYYVFDYTYSIVFVSPFYEVALQKLKELENNER